MLTAPRHRSHRLPLSNPSIVLLTASFFLFTIISTGDENKIFQLIVALFACLLLILMEMMVMVTVLVRIKGIGWWWAREGVQLGPPRSTNHYWPPALPHYWRQHFVQHTTDYWQQTTKYQLGVHNAHTSTLLQLYCENDARGVRAPPQGGPALVLDCGVLGGPPLGTVWILLDKLQCAM